MEEKTYKLLIADDEYWTREKIRNMIEWNEYNIEFMEPAQDGEEVLLRINETKPDILITDINMPIVNGMELISLVKKRHPEVVVFVISGYDDFEYVKTTLMAGAINYLLKPVTKIDLVNAISKALEIISIEEENKKQILKASSLIQDREFSLLVKKEMLPFTPTVNINGIMDFAGCSLMLIKIHNLQEWMEKFEYDMNLLSYSIKKDIKELLGLPNLLIFNHIYRSNEFIIVTEQEDSEQYRMAIKILNYISAQTKAPITIVISEHSYSIESIHTAYIQCVAILMTRKYRHENVILFHTKDNKGIYNEVKNQVPQQDEKQLKRLLKTSNEAMIKEYIFHTIGVQHCEEEEWEFLEVKQTVKKICNILMDYLTEVDIMMAVIDMESLVELADKTIDNFDVYNLCEVLEEIITLVSDVQKVEPNGTIREVVAQAVQYINDNYFEELTLTSLAKRFNVESSYFSKLFRQETGSNLMLYIAKKRIEKAKELIKEQKNNLTEVAFMVGYDDYTYFSKVFRKMTGKSPRDYRGSLDEKK